MSIPAAEGYYQNNNSTYTGLAGSVLRTQAPGVSPNVKGVSLNSGAGYCIEDTEGPSVFDYIGGSPGTVTGTLATIAGQIEKARRLLASFNLRGGS